MEGRVGEEGHHSVRLSVTLWGSVERYRRCCRGWGAGKGEVHNFVGLRRTGEDNFTFKQLGSFAGTIQTTWPFPVKIGRFSKDAILVFSPEQLLSS